MLLPSGIISKDCGFKGMRRYPIVVVLRRVRVMPMMPTRVPKCGGVRYEVCSINVLLAYGGSRSALPLASGS